ncbi:hypothetical protein ACFX12_035493 [Malus domestica]
MAAFLLLTSLACLPFLRTNLSPMLPFFLCTHAAKGSCLSSLSSPALFCPCGCLCGLPRFLSPRSSAASVPVLLTLSVHSRCQGQLSPAPPGSSPLISLHVLSFPLDSFTVPRVDSSISSALPVAVP